MSHKTLYYIVNNDKKKVYMYSTDMIFSKYFYNCGCLNLWVQNLWIWRANCTCVTTNNCYEGHPKHERGHPEFWAPHDVLSCLGGNFCILPFPYGIGRTSCYPSLTLTASLITACYWPNSAGFGSPYTSFH